VAAGQVEAKRIFPGYEFSLLCGGTYRPALAVVAKPLGEMASGPAVVQKVRHGGTFAFISVTRGEGDRRSSSAGEFTAAVVLDSDTEDSAERCGSKRVTEAA
jgi:hypothetical protein